MIAQTGTDDCPDVEAGSRQQRNQLKSTENKNDGIQSSKLKLALMTARVSKRAVANKEIIFSLLKIRMMAGSQLSTFRRSLTARVIWRAVANKEINLNLLKVRKQAFSHQSSNWH